MTTAPILEILKRGVRKKAGKEKGAIVTMKNQKWEVGDVVEKGKKVTAGRTMTKAMTDHKAENEGAKKEKRKGVEVGRVPTVKAIRVGAKKEKRRGKKAKEKEVTPTVMMTPRMDTAGGKEKRKKAKKVERGVTAMTILKMKEEEGVDARRRGAEEDTAIPDPIILERMAKVENTANTGSIGAGDETLAAEVAAEVATGEGDEEEDAEVVVVEEAVMATPDQIPVLDLAPDHDPDDEGAKVIDDVTMTTMITQDLIRAQGRDPARDGDGVSTEAGDGTALTTDLGALTIVEDLEADGIDERGEEGAGTGTEVGAGHQVATTVMKKAVGVAVDTENIVHDVTETETEVTTLTTQAERLQEVNTTTKTGEIDGAVVGNIEAVDVTHLTITATTVTVVSCDVIARADPSHTCSHDVILIHNRVSYQNLFR